MTEFFEWLDQYSLGVEQIDADHKELVGLVNRIVHAVNERQGDAVVRRILEELLDYTVYHFNNEESLMDRAGYPGIEQHRIAHDRLVRSLVGFFSGDRGQPIDAVKVATFMIDWLLQHVLKDDAEFAAYFRRKGIQ